MLKKIGKLGLADEMMNRLTGAKNAVKRLRSPIAPGHVVVAVQYDEAVGQTIDRSVDPLEL
jgi:hypothetical protein